MSKIVCQKIKSHCQPIVEDASPCTPLYWSIQYPNQDLHWLWLLFNYLVLVPDHQWVYYKILTSWFYYEQSAYYDGLSDARLFAQISQRIYNWIKLETGEKRGSWDRIIFSLPLKSTSLIPWRGVVIPLRSLKPKKAIDSRQKTILKPINIIHPWWFFGGQMACLYHQPQEMFCLPKHTSASWAMSCVLCKKAFTDQPNCPNRISVLV